MFAKNMNLRDLITITLAATALGVASNASARPGYGDDVVLICQRDGNTLLYSNVSNDCTVCHGSNYSLGSGANAYRGGNNSIIDYFCPAPATPTCTDNDGDGYFAEGGACGTMDPNDRDATVYPGAPEICDDRKDNDGNGLIDSQDPACMVTVTCTDMDGDGYFAEGGQCGAMDCNDGDTAINPGAAELCSDGIDNNCNGLVDTADPNAVNCPLTCTDDDGDGYSTEGGACGPMDCNDSDTTVNPGAAEICGDGIDNNCDMRVDSRDAVCRTKGSGNVASKGGKGGNGKGRGKGSNTGDTDDDDMTGEYDETD